MTPAQPTEVSPAATRPAAQPPQPSEPGLRRRRRGWMMLAALALVAVAGFLLWNGYFSRRGPENVISLSGRIEGDDSSVAAKLGGRLVEVRVREGDAVNAGDVIAVIDDEQVRAREEQSKAALAQAEARMKAAQEQIVVLGAQLQQNQIQTNQAKVDASGRVRQAEAQLAAAQSTLAQQKAAYDIAAFDRDAYAKLAETGAASEREGKQAISAANQQAAAVTA